MDNTLAVENLPSYLSEVDLSANADETSKGYSHLHEWEYSVDGNSIQAQCVYSNCQYHYLPVKARLNFYTNSVQLEADIAPSYADVKTLTWKSSDTSVATVDTNGKVTAVGSGKAKISATTQDGTNLTDSTEITVKTNTLLKS